MSIRVFTRLTERVLARLGEDALLRGAEGCRVALEHGVEIVGAHSEAVLERTVATMQKAMLPKQGDALSIGAIVAGVFVAESSWVVDSPPFADNGYSVRVVVRAT